MELNIPVLKAALKPAMTKNLIYHNALNMDGMSLTEIGSSEFKTHQWVKLSYSYIK